VLFFDIDQHKRAQEALQEREERLRLALEGGRMGMWIWDVQQNKSFWNRREYELTGAPVGDGEIDTELFFARVHPEDLAPMQTILNDAIKTGKDFQQEFRVMLDNGDERWLIGVGSVYFDQVTGQPVKVMGINYDITERMRTEEALKEADRRKDEFPAVLSHELRNPLAALSNVVQSMRLRNGAVTYDTRVQTLLEGAVHQLVRLVDDLLDVSRITQGKIELRKEHTTLAQIVDMAVASSRALIDENGHQLTLSLPPDDVLLDVDPIRLGQALTNLLTNAAKFTEVGGNLWLVAEVALGAPGHAGDVVFRVRDTGIGISKAMLPQIFDMFTQGKGHGSNRVRNGLGVGLALAKRLVELHGGAIDVRSAGPGAGSEFTVRLPGVVLASESDTETLQSHTAHADDSLRRILLVDDDWLVAFSFEIILKNHGRDVRLAHDGPNAIEAVKSFHPDVMMVDISMPGMDGYEVARHIRAQPEFDGIVLVAQTGYGTDADALRAQEASFDYHLTKPVELGMLQKILADVQRKHVKR
jgi:PAS domain S-box-containing protein